MASRVISGRIPVEMDKQLRQIAQDRGIYLTDLVKEMVTDYLARQSPQTKDHSVPEIPDFM